MAFTSRVLDPKEKLCAIELPDSIYRDLSRRYTRKKPPMGLSVSFQFKGDRYDLAFPTGEGFNPAEAVELAESFNPSDIKEVVRQFREQASKYASEQSIVMFKDRMPESIEEKLISRTGRAFFLPTALSGVPTVDPWANPRILIHDDFERHFIQAGIHPSLVDEEINRFEHSKRKAGILSELMMPIPFQEYIVGYLHLKNAVQGNTPFDISMVDAFGQLAKILAYSLLHNGYFKNAAKKTSAYATEVIDISAGGMLFICSSQRLIDSLVPESSLLVTIKTSARTIVTSALIKRKYMESGYGYFGCEFEDIKAEDFRYLFELVYSRPFTDADAKAAEALTTKNLFKD
jgi:hypothetical protein